MGRTYSGDPFKRGPRGQRASPIGLKEARYYVVKEPVRRQGSKDLRLVSSYGEQPQMTASKEMGSSVSQLKRMEFSQQPYELGREP